MLRYLLALSVSFSMANAAWAATSVAPTGCKAQQHDIQTEIDNAKAQGRGTRGLEKALEENTAHCTDAGLLKHLRDKTVKEEQDLKERQADLQQAEAGGNAEKIAKQQRKLQDDEAELAADKAKLQRYFPGH